jgi:hypothetical protein
MPTMAGRTLFPKETTVVGRAIRTPDTIVGMKKFSQKKQLYQ